LKSESKICFVGAGAMAEAIIAGILKQGRFMPEAVYAVNRSNRSRLAELAERYRIQADPEHKERYVREADILILAVKPKDIPATLAEIRPWTNSGQLVISVAAGVRTQAISSLLEHDAPIVRTMPNTSAAVGLSATGICGGSTAARKHVRTAADIFSAVGQVFEVPEELMDAVTAVAGSGPAFIYYVVESMISGAVKVGLDEETGKALVLQMLAGASAMLAQSGKSPAALREEICSPGGTTLAGLGVLASREVDQAFVACIEAAVNRARELADALGK